MARLLMLLTPRVTCSEQPPSAAFVWGFRVRVWHRGLSSCAGHGDISRSILSTAAPEDPAPALHCVPSAEPKLIISNPSSVCDHPRSHGCLRECHLTASRSQHRDLTPEHQRRPQLS